MAVSMSVLRFENALRIALGTSRSSLSPLRSEIPGETEGCQLGPQCGPVEGAGGLLPQVELATVRGRPPAVGSLDQVGHDDVGVELGIAGPAGAVAEGRTDEAVGLDQLRPTTASPGEAGLGREVINHRGDRPVVSQPRWRHEYRRLRTPRATTRPSAPRR